MSSAPVPQTAQPSDPGVKATDRIVIYSHSNFFYWWPIWVLGYFFALITLTQDEFLYVVPAGTVASKRMVEVDGKMVERSVLVLPEGKKLWEQTNEAGK